MTEREVSSERVIEYFVEQVAKEIAKHTYARCLPQMSDCEDWDAMEEADRKIYRTAAAAALSQASSVIAGLEDERDEAKASAFVWENRFVLMDGAYKREFSRAQAILSAYERGRKEGIEEAAKVVEKETEAPAQRNSKSMWVQDIGDRLATAIRQLLEVKG